MDLKEDDFSNVNARIKAHRDLMMGFAISTDFSHVCLIIMS